MPVPKIDPAEPDEPISIGLRSEPPFRTMWPTKDATDEITARVQMQFKATQAYHGIYGQFDQAVETLLADGVLDPDQVGSLVAGIHIGIDWLAHWLETAFDVDLATLGPDHQATLGPEASTLVTACMLINQKANEPEEGTDDSADAP